MDKLQVILNLQKQTLDGQINWKFETEIPHLIDYDPNVQIITCFKYADHQSHCFYLYSCRYPVYNEDCDAIIGYNEHIELTITQQGFIIYQFSESEALSNLYTAVCDKNFISTFGNQFDLK